MNTTKVLKANQSNSRNRVKTRKIVATKTQKAQEKARVHNTKLKT